MSTSPQRRYYYDSKPPSRPTSPPTPAEVRSQAIAKLKRAASLPRNKNGGRPSPSPSPSSQATAQFTEPLNGSGLHREGREEEEGGEEGGDREEILSPSPTNQSFDHDNLYNDGTSRSASQASEFHIPTPPVMMYSHSSGTPYSNSPSYGGSSASTPDWAAMQLAQSYLPSLSPAALSPSPFGTHQHSSRNTPSPLPTLGDLRTLQRSNSAMARARAMDKLTGGRGTSPLPPPAAQDDMTLVSGSGTRLQRSGTVGPRLAEKQVESVEELAPDLPAAPIARPRLQRSFTVSSTNMGEERRSAVGRRMVERLAERRAAREKEEAEVRQIWEERRAAAEHHEERSETPEMDTEEVEPEGPLVHRSSPAEPPAEQMPHSVTFGQTETHTLGVPDRPISRETMRSNGGPFEYESHLRRSLSSRTARGAVGVVSDSEPDPVPPVQGSDVEQLDGRGESPAPSTLDEHDNLDLTPPRPAFITPSRHVPHSSTSTDGTIQAGQSPGSDSSQSRDALNSMMFVMGGGGHANGVEGRPESGWPREVEESGSTDWGSPSRMHEPRTPQLSSPRDQATPIHSQLSSAMNSQYETQSSSPLSQPPRESVMSWEEVGGTTDLEVPSDAHYHKTSESVSAKIGRSVKTALRKRSQSRGSADSGGAATSPRLGEAITTAVQHFSRRGSASSVSPALPTNQQMSHQPSISSLSPSLARSDSVSNSALLQHEGPTHGWMPPRADPDDPRIASSKMSPFPGIAALEEKNKGNDLVPPDAPRLVHQASDSVVPTQQRTQPAEPIYALPLPSAGADVSRRGSADSAQKRSWLAKAFTSPRSSDSNSRKSSTHEVSPILDDKTASQVPSAAGPDPFAAPPLPAPAPVRKMSASRATASPSVSIVHEANEDRLTRFTATPVARRGEDNATPLADGELTEKSKDVLKRMDDLLALGPDDPARPEMLDDPPRKLVLSSQVLQVVNTHTAKDRFLFLFNDILVIAKPLITQGVQATLDMKYLVKSVVPLDQVHVSEIDPEPSSEPPHHAVVEAFIQKFADDALAACRYLVDRSTVRFDAITLASLLYKTPELDKSQLGRLLASNEKLLRAYVDRFKFTGIRIDEALRVFLLSLRMPHDPNDSENLLRGFAHRYFDANRNHVSFDRDLAAELVLATIQLNDALYGTFGFALPNHAITKDIFISAFHSKDPRSLVPDDLLGRIYSSITSQPLAQSLGTHQLAQAREVLITPSRYQTKLTYGVWSDLIDVSIPRPDPTFRVKLRGQGVEFDPPLLDFADGATQSFRVRGTSLGTKSALFVRQGRNAALYAGMGNGRTFVVERAFMRHTFHLSFPSPATVKRKYCFSVPDADTKARWASVLQKQIAQTRSRRSRATSEVRHVAETVSLQVLRDAVIPPDSPATDPKSPDETSGSRTRQGSVSTTYKHTAGREEVDLGPLQPSRVAAKGEEAVTGLVEVQTGKELVLLCRQNSLLPGLLELLSAGRGDAFRTVSGEAGITPSSQSGHVRSEGRKGSVATRF